MDKIRFYQPPNFMNIPKPQSPKLPALFSQAQLSNPLPQRHIHIPHRPSSLTRPSQQLKHPLPPRPSFFDESPVSHSASQCSQSPETPRNDLDRILGEVSSNDEGQSLDRSQSDTDDHATVPIGLNPRKSPGDRLNMTMKVNTVTESVSEAGCLDAYQSGASKGQSLNSLIGFTNFTNYHFFQMTPSPKIACHHPVHLAQIIALRTSLRCQVYEAIFPLTH